MMEALPQGSTVGIIGGGQLGRMLAMAAARLGYRTCILEPQADCPAAQVANSQIVGAYDDLDALEELASSAHVVTYEFENVAVGGVAHLARTRPFHPCVAALEVSQDRLSEKTFLNDLGIATAGFRAIDGQEELRSALDAFSGRGVLKTRRMGYDGKGQIVFDGTRDGEGAFVRLGSVPLILEEFIAFEREISVVAARGQDGAVVSYEPAENVHENGILSRSTVPARIDTEIADQARAAVRSVLENLDYVGVIAIEFFVGRDGALIANEIAPRVHNSGHWSEALCAVSQFENHIRAICGLSLGNSRRHSDGVMHNLLGEDVVDVAPILEAEDTVLHLYGKREVRPGRKMGHYTRISPFAGRQ